ncbi:hypothetical protein KCP75_01660 [Salmonella enterica subsp. enterica]|nr:hypothetical protein KCP75_01660 [Salmonella enterica subsp. enterica]
MIDGFGGTGPRMTAVRIWQQRKAVGVATDFCSACHALYAGVERGGRLTFVRDGPSDAVWTHYTHPAMW